MAAGKLGAEVLKPIPVSCATSEIGNDAHSERVAANAGEMLTEQIGGATDVAGGCSPDQFNVMAFPGHQVANGGTWGCLGDGGEIGDGESEARIGLDCVTECLYGGRAARGLLCLAIEGGGLDVGRDHPTVVLDRRTARGHLPMADVGPFWISVHDYQVALVT